MLNFMHQHCTCQEFRELLGIIFFFCNISRLVLLKCYFNIVVKRIFIFSFLRWKPTSTFYMRKSISRMVATAANPYEIWNQDVFFSAFDTNIALSYLLILIASGQTQIMLENCSSLYWSKITSNLPESNVKTFLLVLNCLHYKFKITKCFYK